MRTQPACVHRDCHKRLFLIVARDYPPGGDGADATDANRILTEVADRWDLSVRLDGDAIGQLHDQRPAVVQVPVPEHPVHVFDDAAYDTVALYETARARGATVVVPPARTANVSGHGPRSPARDRMVTLVKQLGRRRWKKVSGYHRQGRVENTFFRDTSIIGAGLRARSPAGQGSEVVLGCEILNRMTELGRPVSYRIDR